jgi:putative tributyrin esterase
MIRYAFFVCLLVAVAVLPASNTAVARGAVQRESLWSPALGVRKNLQVYLPPSYAASAASGKRYPVAVYLHGKWGDETDWLDRGRLAQTMDSLIAAGMPEMLVVLPDGDDGWWTTWESPSDTAACRRETHRGEPAAEFCVPSPRYDEYVVRDVIPFVDSAYRTIARSASRGIGGVSMGGYGAFTIVARFPGTFAAAASHAGILTPGLLPDSGTIATTGRVSWRVGSTTEELRWATGPRWDGMYPMFGLDAESWRARDPARLLTAMRAAGKPVPALYVDVAKEDEVLQQNRLFRAAMLANGIPLSYTESKGAHSWTFYREHLPFGLQFIASHLAH